MSNHDSVPEKSQDELLRSTVVLQALPDGVVICDRAGMLRFINPAAARLLQIDADAYVLQSIDNVPGGIVLPDESGQQVPEQFIKIAYEDLRCKIIPICSERPKKARIGFLITIKPASLETMSLEELRTIVGYEFRAPLTSIMGCTDLLLRNVVGEMPGKQRELIQIVNNVSKRLFNVVNNVISVIQFDLGRVRLSIEETNVSEIVNDIIVSKKKLFADTDIICDVKVSPDLFSVRIDQYKLYEILTHLLDNAFRYTPSGGNISVNVRIAADQLCCDIQDSGIGISESARPRVFTRFVNDYNNPLRDKIDHYSGVGLGLTIAKRLVELQGGQMWFESAVGQGSTFSFTLPLSNEV